jgi:hypothetical protein
MARRYRVLKENKVANIFDLNAKPDATERLPLLWIIHDEFAEWMLTRITRMPCSDIVSRLGCEGPGRRDLAGVWRVLIPMPSRAPNGQG